MAKVSENIHCCFVWFCSGIHTQ